MALAQFLAVYISTKTSIKILKFGARLCQVGFPIREPEVISLLFLLRSIGDFRYVSFFKIAQNARKSERILADGRGGI